MAQKNPIKLIQLVYRKFDYLHRLKYTMRLCNNTNKASMSTKLLACTKNKKI